MNISAMVGHQCDCQSRSQREPTRSTGNMPLILAWAVADMGVDCGDGGSPQGPIDRSREKAGIAQLSLQRLPELRAPVVGIFRHLVVGELIAQSQSPQDEIGSPGG